MVIGAGVGGLACAARLAATWHQVTVFEQADGVGGKLGSYERRTPEVQGVLAERCQHRISFHDLIIAAASERHRVTVLHYDADYDLITEVTGQATQWVVPRGTVP